MLAAFVLRVLRLLFRFRLKRHTPKNCKPIFPSRTCRSITVFRKVSGSLEMLLALCVPLLQRLPFACFSESGARVEKTSSAIQIKTRSNVSSLPRNICCACG
jgi:hypothetical protein